MITMTSVEAQNHFGALLDSAQREPVTITRRGRTVAYLLSPQDFEQLSRGPAVRVEEQVRAARSTVAAFRGQGSGGSTARLIAERQADRESER